MIGSNGNGLLIGNELFQYERGKSDGLSGNKVFDVICDGKGRLWIALLDGGLNGSEKDMDGNYTFKQFFTSSFPYPSFRTLEIDSTGRIWAGTNMGIFIFDPDRLLEDDTAFELLNTRNGRIRSNQISAFEMDEKGRIWIAESGA